MRRVFLSVSVLLATSIFLAACGQATTQAPADSPTSVPAAVANDPAPTATEKPVSPTEESVPPTEVNAVSSGTNEVQITLGDNWIQSSQTTFKVGVPYTFVITNTGRRNHRFDISKPAEKTTDAIREALANALLAISDDDLPPGAQVTAEFTFSAPAAPGELEFACLIERHYKDGQYLAIVVES